jgi:hypothetical protein
MDDSKAFGGQFSIRDNLILLDFRVINGDLGALIHQIFANVDGSRLPKSKYQRVSKHLLMISL